MMRHIFYIPTIPTISQGTCERESLRFYENCTAFSECMTFKVEKILKGSQNSISSPSRSHKHLCFFRQNIAGHCQHTVCPKSLLTAPSNVLPLHPKPIFPPIIWSFTEDGGDSIEFRLPFKIFSTLLVVIQQIWI